MADKDTIPALLRPLTGACTIAEGSQNAEALMRDLRDALGSSSAWRTLRVRPGRAIYELKTAQGDFIVKAHEAGFMARMAPQRFCRTGREWKAIQRAQRLDLPTPNAPALLSARGKPSVNYLVIERLPGVTELGSWIDREHDRLLSDVRLLRRTLTSFAHFVARLHKAGLLHHDLHLRNVMVRPPRSGKPPEFFIIDLVDEEPTGTLPPESQRRSNLAILGLSFLEVPQSVRRRFLRLYREAIGDDSPERDAAHDIEDRAVARQFDLNTARISTCTEASSVIARVQRKETRLLIYRRAERADLEQLEVPLAKAEPDRWPDLLYQHFELRLGEGNVWKLRSQLDSLDSPSARRKVEALWGRLLELNAIGFPAPTPLACVMKVPDMTIFARVPGALTPLVQQKDHNSLSLFEDLGRHMVRLHRFGCFVLPLETETIREGLMVASGRRGGRSVLFTAPDNIFRGSPTTLGQQAVASLGRVGRTLLEFCTERAMKELVWSYARILRLSPADTQELLDEARRVPTGNTLVMTRGIQRTN